MPELSTPITIAISIAVGLFSVLLIHMIKSGSQPYEAREKLLTGAEINFYRHMHRAIGDAATIFCMVRMADILTVKKSVKGKRLKQKIAPIAQKHLDFVLVDRDMNILAAIELNDKTHELPERKARDAFVRKTLKDASIPLIEIPAARTYELQKIRDVIAYNVPSLLIPMSVPEAVKARKEVKWRDTKSASENNAVAELDEHPEFLEQELTVPSMEHDHKVLSDFISSDSGSQEKPLTAFERAKIKAQEYEQSRN